MGTNLLIALLSAAIAAGVFAVSAVLQQQAAREAPDRESLSWRLIADLLHRKTWDAGMACVVLGYVLQAVAFGFAPVAIVEPVIGIEVVFALPLAARLKHLQLGRREWLGAGAVVVGVGGFLWLSDAVGGNPEPALVRWALVAVPTFVVVVATVVWSRCVHGAARAPLLATAAGLSFALMALVTQSAVQEISRAGAVGVLESWQPYVIAFVAPVAFTIAQSAYQAGPLAMSLPVLDSLEPTVSILLAVVAFRQHLSVALPHLVGEVVCAAVALTGIVLLARSPLVISVYEQTEKEHHRDGSGTTSPPGGKGRPKRQTTAA